MSTNGTSQAEPQILADLAQITATASDPRRLALNPDELKNGLGKLVLSLVELLRQLLERQAIRRIESGSLTEAEAEKLGVAFMRLAAQMEDMKRAFGVTDEELNMDLGPLGRLF